MRKSVIITGASRGIGRAAALRFSREGWQVVIQYLTGEKQAMELLGEIRSGGADAIAVRADVSNRQDVDRMVKACVENFGGVSVLVNNAGIAQSRLFTDITANDWDRMMNVNVKGVFHSCQAVLPHMIYKKSGKIINVSSMWGQVGAACEVHYSAAKAAVIGLTKSLAKEVAPSGIQVNCVAPGVIKTNMLSEYSDDELRELAMETPLLRLGTPEDVADTIYFLASSQSDFMTGQVLCPNGGFVI